MFQTFDFAFVECCAWPDNEGTKGHSKKTTIIMKDVNDNELVLSSFGVVLEVNERGGQLL